MREASLYLPRVFLRFGFLTVFHGHIFKKPREKECLTRKIPCIWRKRPLNADLFLHGADVGEEAMTINQAGRWVSASTSTICCT